MPYNSSTHSHCHHKTSNSQRQGEVEEERREKRIALGETDLNEQAMVLSTEKISNVRQGNASHD